MTLVSRLALTAPFFLLIVQYLSFSVAVVDDPAIPAFWKNHGLRETIFAIIISGIVFNLIWSKKITRSKLTLVLILGSPLILSFWIINAAVGFGDFDAFRPVYVSHIVEVVLFYVGYLMAVSTRFKDTQ